VGAAVAALLSSADAMFLSRVGSRHLGTAFALSSAVSMGLLWLVGGLADRSERSRLLWRSSGLALALVLAVISINSVFPRAAATFLIVGGKQIGGTLELLLWVVIADRFTAREARRILPWVIVANGAGGALGAVSVGPLANAFGTVGPLWAAAGVLALVAMNARLLLSAPDHRIAQPRVTPGSTRAQGAPQSGFAVLRERPLARWLALMVATAGIFAPMMYYLVGVTAAGAYGNEVELAGFLGRYRAYVMGAGLAAQLAIAPWLSQRLGIGLMLLLAPLGAVVVAVWVGLQPGLIVVLVAQAATRVFDNAIQDPAEQLIQNLLPQQVRGRVAGLVGGVAKRSGAMVGGLAASLLIVWPTLFSLTLFLSAAGWLLVATLLSRRFSELAVAELSDAGDSSKFSVAPLKLRFSDERGLRQLRKRLLSEELREQANSIALLGRLAQIGNVDAIEELLAALQSDAARPEELRAAIRSGLGNGARPGAAAQVRALRMLESETLEDREVAIAVLGCAELGQEEAEALRLAVEGSESLVSQVAAARLEGSSVLDLFRGAGHGAEVVHELCAEIARAMRGTSPDAAEDLAERLLRSVARHGDPELQAAGLQAVVKTLKGGEESAIFVLLRTRLRELSERWRGSSSARLREAGLVAMRAGGSEDFRLLALALGDRDEAVRKQAEILLREAGDAALEALSIASQSGRRRVRLAAVEILADLRPSQAALDSLLEQELAEIQRCAEHEHALRDLPQSELVRRRLSERIDEGVEAALMTLEARHHKEGIGEVARRLARAASERSRARALEALDTLLPRKISRTILGALEGTLSASLATEEAVHAELAGRDVLTRDLLVHALGSEGRATYRESIASAATAAARAVDPMALVERLAGGNNDKVLSDVPSLLETIVILSELPLFADLSTVQLEELATVVRWESAAEGEVLMHQGEDAHCMYLLRSGSLDVVVDGEKKAELGAGEPVGELALFGEDKRTATVVAASDCQLGVVTREDIENLVEEVPGIALRLCRAMSRRLADMNRA
jgi:hypothetical protein